jgi:hypothetical protein
MASTEPVLTLLLLLSLWCLFVATGEWRRRYHDARSDAQFWEQAAMRYRNMRDEKKE